MRGRRGIAGKGRRAASVVLVLGVMLGMTACANDPLADQYRSGDNKGYIAGDFRVVEIPADQRGPAVEFAGTTESGEAVSSSDYADEVLVVNFWYAACGPCRAEAPVLESVWKRFDGQGASFLGVNSYDQAATAASFAQDYGVTYPSVIDINDKKVTLAFAAVAPLSATPVTLVLDTQGRVAARIIGAVSEEDESILSSLVSDAIAETS
ncbi:TlpA family protein disulfide reductase [Microbacterium sp. P03]|uniref:TlpA family protein disulfide reductase n=1 Tax=Microbacterium sp. P03 TaxID=3366946 RepID=UPI003744D9AE